MTLRLHTVATKAECTHTGIASRAAGCVNISAELMSNGLVHDEADLTIEVYSLMVLFSYLARAYYHLLRVFFLHVALHRLTESQTNRN